MLKATVRAASFLLVSAFFCSSLPAENWPGWRGPRGDGTSAEKNVPLRWSAEKNIAWKVRTAYAGHASPVVFGDFVFVVGADLEKKNRMLVAIDRKTGRTLWEQVVLHAPLETKHTLNSFASSTPATDGKLIYVTFLEVGSRTIPARNVSRVRPVTPGRMVVAAYDFEGRQKWRVKPGEFVSVHGFSSSPVLYQDMVIVNGDHDGKGYIVALSRQTGKTLWKTSRENNTRSYCTPIIRRIGGRTQMMLSGSLSVASYDPNDGSRHWVIEGPTEQFVASMIYHQGLLFLTCGYPERHVLAIDPSGSGDVSNTHIRWRHYRKGVSYVPSPVAAGRFFYLSSDNGIGTCFDAATGAIQWQKRLGRHYSGSLIATDRHVYYQDDDGTTQVVKVGPKFEVLAENRLDEAVYSSPAVSHGQIFVRAEDHLFCIGQDTARAAR